MNDRLVHAYLCIGVLLDGFATLIALYFAAGAISQNRRLLGVALSAAGFVIFVNLLSGLIGG